MVYGRLVLHIDSISDQPLLSGHYYGEKGIHVLQASPTVNRSQRGVPKRPPPLDQDQLLLPGVPGSGPRSRVVTFLRYASRGRVRHASRPRGPGSAQCDKPPAEFYCAFVPPGEVSRQFSKVSQGVNVSR
ncbi:hypothetical protein NDU88_006713 [Pleurodeles waltl]|uniref:Uncharacterized protein n=1 Tax=Pleurodeles waltl TaxID=8319 RepID=A0AAV7LXN7_PLEWA|nr:hypothetical protein NDU88_006713 [Pleurodeles waltl]